MLDHVLGLDHIVVAVSELSASAERWRALGFSVSPRGLHSDYLGTANHTIMFEDDYVELLGVLAPTDFNRPTRDFLAAGAGLERLAMRTDDAQAALDTLKRGGISATGPFEFRRPVELGSGGVGEAGFRIFQWPLEPAPAGVRLFACQHLTRETVWLPDLVSHANGARALSRIEIVAEDPPAAAALCAQMLGLTFARGEDGGFCVAMRPRGADLVFMDAPSFDRRWQVGAQAQGTGCGIVLDVAASTTAEPFAEWSIAGEWPLHCASVEGALIGWEAGRRSARP